MMKESKRVGLRRLSVMSEEKVHLLKRKKEKRAAGVYLTFSVNALEME